MFENDEGGCAASPKRRELLGNLLWALNGVEPKHGLAAVAQIIYEDDSFDAPTRWLAGLRLVDAWSLPGREGDLEAVLTDLLDSPLSGGEQRAWLARHHAGLLVRTGRNEEAVAALRSALAESPSLEIYQGLALLLDRRLDRPNEAKRFYEAYLENGGNDAKMKASWSELTGPEAVAHP